jgi:hypothetical protein
MAVPRLIAVAYQTVTTTQPPPDINAEPIGDALAVGLLVFGLVALVGVFMLSEKKTWREFLVDPPAVFSPKDGWLTNLTGLSAAAVAVAAGTGVADAMLDKGTQAQLALVGFIVVAILGLAPIVLGATIRFKEVQRDDKPTMVTFTPTWAYVLAASVTAGGAATQLAGLREAADGLRLSGNAPQRMRQACLILGAIAVAYVLTIIYKTIQLSGPEPEDEGEGVDSAMMPRSLTL